MRNPDCQLCSLWETAETPCLWGQGPTESLMVIGDGPGAEEDRKDYPISGKVGKLLTQLFEEVGLPKPYLTNVIRCKIPYQYKIKAAELKACKGYLAEEIRSVKPTYVILLGATALKAVTRSAKITEMHGQLLEVDGIKYFPTFHPAMALRDPSKMEPLKKDLVRLRQIMSGSLHQEPQIPWQVIRTLDQWDDFITGFSKADLASFDLETTGLDRKAPGAAVNTIQIAYEEGGEEKEAIAIPLSVRASPWTFDMQKMFIGTLVAIATEHQIKMCAHNGKFDNLWLEEIYGVKFYLQFDTMLASHTLDENASHGLKELAVSYCDAPAYDIDLKTKKGQGDLEKLFKYGCFDSYYTLRLRRIFHSKLVKDPQLRRLFYKLVMPAARMFEEIEREGLYLNLPLLEQRRRELTRKRNNYERKLNSLAGKPVNWNSPKQISDLLFDEMGLPVLDKTPAGAPSTSESVLLRLEHEIPKLLIKMRGVEKNLSTYINGWESLRHGDYLYISTKLHGTVTGRYASRLHQVPRDKDIRSLIDAPPGWTHVCADYSQIELRLVAMVSGDMRMRQAFQVGQDLHRLTASEVLGVPQSLVTKEQRKMAKAVNFGFVYGMWWKKFGIYARDNYGVHVTDNESKRFRARYFETYSGLEPWHGRQRRTVRAMGYVSSLSGRRRRLPGVYSSDESMQQEAERQAINSPIQGFGSGDLKAMALLEVHEAFDQDVLRIKGEVHDSNLMWIRTDCLHWAIPLVKKIMEQPKLLEGFGIKMTVPLVVDFEVGPWGAGQEWVVIDGVAKPNPKE
jgi:uracil-DNA glycosylase family 4